MVIGICWYLSVLFLLASACVSAITVAPGYESFEIALVTGNLVGSLLFAAAAIDRREGGQAEPDVADEPFRHPSQVGGGRPDPPSQEADGENGDQLPSLGQLGATGAGGGR